MVDVFLLYQALSGPHEVPEREEAGKYHHRSARDQPDMRSRDLFQEKRQDYAGGEDPQYEGDLHEYVEEIVNANPYGMKLVLLVRCFGYHLARVQAEKRRHEAEVNHGYGVNDRYLSHESSSLIRRSHRA